MTARQHRHGVLASRPYSVSYATPAIIQSNYNTAATGAATATISAATAGNLLVAIVAAGTNAAAIAGSGWTTIAANGSGSARSQMYAKVAAGGETSESTTGTQTNESIWLIEASGATATLTGTAQTVVDGGAGVNTLAIPSATAAIPGLVIAYVATNGTTTSPSWTAGGLNLLDGARIHAGYLAVTAGSYGGTLTWTGTARRASGSLAVFGAKTL